jgi:hypothetical protein
VGGDDYDYTVAAHRAYIAVFDAVGHDLAAGLTPASPWPRPATPGVGHDMAAAAAQADQVIVEQERTRFVTAGTPPPHLGLSFAATNSAC